MRRMLVMLVMGVLLMGEGGVWKVWLSRAEFMDRSGSISGTLR